MISRFTPAAQRAAGCGDTHILMGIVAGRSAFLETFILFGVDPGHYDDAFGPRNSTC
ncbi:hypothetical protein [Streptomyces sp. NPDC058240]|uniref:hypothetical protein n=1 Tax=Streptomyces sp. NPDC058240 TaxID=3346396 RepID=UPI0036E4BFBE